MPRPKKVGGWPDSNRRREDYEAPALAAELHPPTCARRTYSSPVGAITSCRATFLAINSCRAWWVLWRFSARANRI
jgi:hypothetical protein